MTTTSDVVAPNEDSNLSNSEDSESNNSDDEE